MCDYLHEQRSCVPVCVCPFLRACVCPFVCLHIPGSCLCVCSSLCARVCVCTRVCEHAHRLIINETVSKRYTYAINFTAFTITPVAVMGPSCMQYTAAASGTHACMHRTDKLDDVCDLILLHNFVYVSSLPDFIVNT